MSGSRTGGLKTKKTILERYGIDWYKKIGKIGGKACVPKGFAANPELAKRVGSKGGKISRRSKNHYPANESVADASANVARLNNNGDA